MLINSQEKKKIITEYGSMVNCKQAANLIGKTPGTFSSYASLGKFECPVSSGYNCWSTTEIIKWINEKYFKFNKFWHQSCTDDNQTVSEVRSRPNRRRLPFVSGPFLTVHAEACGTLSLTPESSNSSPQYVSMSYKSAGATPTEQRGWLIRNWE